MNNIHSVKNPLDSNNIKTIIRTVCAECGITANVLTCLKRYGQPPLNLAYSVSTYHEGECDFCHSKKQVTEARDFFFPDFSLIGHAVKHLKSL